MSDNLSQNILATICYYDCLDYPLTAFEVHKYLTTHNQPASPVGGQPTTHPLRQELSETSNPQRFSLGDVIKMLEGDDLKKYIGEHRGFYFLKGRKNLVLERIKREKISAAQIKKLRRVVWLLRLVPFVRMIGVTGRLAMKNAEEKSDWDILVILKGGKIWTGRTLVTLLVHLIGKRRHKNKIKDRVCLNYFITGDSLEISTRDLYSSNEYYFTFPLFDADIFKKFRLKNRWIKNFKPNYQPEEIGNLRIIKDSWLSRTSRTLGEALFGFDFLEKWLRKWAKGKIMRNPKTREKGGLIIASDEKLIFLPEPQGPEVFERFKNEINKINALTN